MLGISIYLTNQSMEEQESYIQKMRQLGFDNVFTSLHIPEDNSKNYKERLADLGKLTQLYNMELFADISPKSLGYLGYTFKNVHQLQEWGVTGLRVDYGIADETIAELSKQINIALNASTITHENMKRLRKYDADFSSIEAWHNYYPRPETGLSLEDFNEKNRFLKNEGVNVMAFIPGDGEKRGPLFQGLPTIEAHRNRSTFSSYLEFLNNKWVDKVLISDPSISKSSEKQFAKYEHDTILLRALCYSDNKTSKERLRVKQTNRLDAARDVIRSAESRQYGLIGDFPIKPDHTIERKEGSITVDNEKYGRYQGEIQITKRPLPADEKVNVIGRVIDEDRFLLPFIKGGMAFQIEWID
ncbi:DUF871 domain-containing protein [Oceanobacillus senegalensis]|uniref:DUF871 domain-containing protein n=1 Tax=Oceanobacillus senegalensis TaxID=1936063 RepID=UPI000A3101E5|nr:MupG family TIM beta-alpha barrel fold protein [Oceanobacillus senegalensis]